MAELIHRTVGPEVTVEVVEVAGLWTILVHSGPHGDEGAEVAAWTSAGACRLLQLLMADL
jgi:hypothetical protein